MGKPTIATSGATLPDTTGAQGAASPCRMPPLYLMYLALGLILLASDAQSAPRGLSSAASGQDATGERWSGLIDDDEDIERDADEDEDIWEDDEEDEDIWGDDEEDEDVDIEDPDLEHEESLQPWTYNMKRANWNVFLPSATTLDQGEMFVRISHVSQVPFDEEPVQSLFGLDDSVRIGIMWGIGITDDFEASLQRTTGRKTTQYDFDYYDVVFKYHLPNTFTKTLDLAVIYGYTVMLPGNTKDAHASLNLGLMAEHSVWEDRIRVGLGVHYSSFSTYDRTLGLDSTVPGDKPQYEEEEFFFREPHHTVAAAANLHFALHRSWMLLAEFAIPFDGFRTYEGPTSGLGFRYSTSSHDFNFYFTNSSNNSYNAVITGGFDMPIPTNLQVFGFSITSYF